MLPVAVARSSSSDYRDSRACVCGDSEWGVSPSPCKSSVEDVPLRAKPAINFHDAVFYYPAEQTTDDEEDSGRGLAHALSESRVPVAGAAACCSSELPLKEAVSVGDDTPLMGSSAASRRRPSVLRRMRAFFARSSSTGDGHDEMGPAGRQLSAADASMTSPTLWTELDEAQSVPSAVGGGGVVADELVTARPARSYTLPPTDYLSKQDHRSATPTKPAAEQLAGSLMAVAAAGEQPRDTKTTEDQLMYSCKYDLQP